MKTIVEENEKAVFSKIEEEVYIVKKGDTLFTIAERSGLSFERLIELNPQFKLDPDILRIGDEITLKLDSEAEILTDIAESRFKTIIQWFRDQFNKIIEQFSARMQEDFEVKEQELSEARENKYKEKKEETELKMDEGIRQLALQKKDDEKFQKIVDQVVPIENNDSNEDIDARRILQHQQYFQKLKEGYLGKILEIMEQELTEETQKLSDETRIHFERQTGDKKSKAKEKFEQKLHELLEIVDSHTEDNNVVPDKFKDEAQIFLCGMTEELYHGIDNVQ